MSQVILCPRCYEIQHKNNNRHCYNCKSHLYDRETVDIDSRSVYEVPKITVDEWIAPAVSLLNKKGYITWCSCQGHSEYANDSIPYVCFKVYYDELVNLINNDKKFKEFFDVHDYRDNKDVYFDLGIYAKYRHMTISKLYESVTMFNKLSEDAIAVS